MNAASAQTSIQKRRAKIQLKGSLEYKKLSPPLGCHADSEPDYSSSGKVECLFLEFGCSFALSGELIIVASDSYDGGRSSSNLIDRSVLLLLRPPPAMFDLAVFDRLTCPLLSRNVFDRLTWLPLPCWEFERLTPPCSSLICWRSFVEESVPLRLLPLLPVGCSNEKAVLLLLRPCGPPATIDTFLACEACDICDRCDRCDMALCILEWRIGFLPILRSRRLVQQHPMPACKTNPIKAHPVAIHMNTNIRVPTYA